MKHTFSKTFGKSIKFFNPPSPLLPDALQYLSDYENEEVVKDVVHSNVWCSNIQSCPNINKPISGIRFMSVFDSSYNLCETCERLASSSSTQSYKHFFLALKRPIKEGSTIPKNIMDIERCEKYDFFEYLV